MWVRLVDFVAHKTREGDGVATPQSILTKEPNSGSADGQDEDQREGSTTTKLSNSISIYTNLYDDRSKDDKQRVKARQLDYATLVKEYYNVASDMYEYGWGESFHFSNRFRGETFEGALARHEYYLASRIGLKPKMRALDLGCGIGGPMRAIARFSGAHVTGVTINSYQVQRAQYLNRASRTSNITEAIVGDFQDLQGTAKIGLNTFDAAYAIEATCHSPDKLVCFKEVYKALKPGAMFAVYEWCMTPLYDPQSKYHRDIKAEIERGNALPTLPSQAEVVDAFTQAGFDVLEATDLNLDFSKMLGDHNVPWYTTLQGGMSWANWKHSRLGRKITQTSVDVLEYIGVAPTGVSETHRMLCRAADALALGGENGIFTPMFLVVARKNA